MIPVSFLFAEEEGKEQENQNASIISPTIEDLSTDNDSYNKYSSCVYFFHEIAGFGTALNYYPKRNIYLGIETDIYIFDSVYFEGIKVYPSLKIGFQLSQGKAFQPFVSWGIGYEMPFGTGTYYAGSPHAIPASYEYPLGIEDGYFLRTVEMGIKIRLTKKNYIEIAAQWRDYLPEIPGDSIFKIIFPDDFPDMSSYSSYYAKISLEMFF